MKCPALTYFVPFTSRGLRYHGERNLPSLAVSGSQKKTDCGPNLFLVDAGLARAAKVELVDVLDLATALRLDFGMFGDGRENTSMMGWRSVGIYGKGWGAVRYFVMA